MDLPEHVAENRRHWDDIAHEWIARGERAWAADEPSWGMWGIPESELGLLPADLTGQTAIELGCGTAYVASWLARRGARVTGIDNSERQLDTARRLAAEHGVTLELIHGNAEEVPRAGASFDFAISEYGAAIWCDPTAWIPEAHRLLRPGGHLVFLGHHPLTVVCTPLDGDDVDARLHRPYFGMSRQDWREVPIDPGGIDFNLTISAWFALFTEVGFAVERYLELQAPDGPDDTPFFVSRRWARRWPAEQAWVLRKR